MYRSTKKACWKCGQQVEHYISTNKQHRYFFTRAVKDKLKYFTDEFRNVTYGYWTKKIIPNWENPVFTSKKLKHKLIPIKHLVLKNKHWEICKGSEVLN